MRMDHESSLTPRWIVFGTALVYFALGSLMTAHFMHLKEEWADSHRVFQLEIHHAAPGKIPALEERLRRGRQAAGFLKYVESEGVEQPVEGVDATFAQPTDDSATK